MDLCVVFNGLWLDTVHHMTKKTNDAIVENIKLLKAIFSFSIAKRR